MLTVKLSNLPANAPWGVNALISYQADNVTVHYDDAFSFRRIQQGGRQLQAQGVEAVSLSGDGWNYERQWAFYCGFAATMETVTIKWASIDEDELELLNARRHSHDWARKIINTGSDTIYPQQLAKAAVRFLTEIGGDHISAEMISGDELLADGWIGIHSVGRGSQHSPVLLSVDYNPSADPDAPVSACLVGKGITFDSGGYSLKPSAGMVSMKCDMGGAATVTAALGYAIAQGLTQRVKLILCCAENMVSGDAYKLGDVLTYRNGVSVEIVNTDAEGRLVLADGLLMASATKAPLIIDAATLTGAAMMAVGGDYNAIFGFDKALLARAQQLSELVNEPAWPLPLEKWHQGYCPSAFADTANSRVQKGGGMGGASNAAGFLSRFVDTDNCSWIHFDLAACYRDSADPRWAVGATGLGIANIAALLL
ncbi:aminopeptidase PepB [Photobacterium iliopiscarium]|uniref:aminopeptidase PepB n=1 Tax=Photobacterium iliopiscarium TaxID=56192 RepID=UPI0005D42713|nr:aminopeptidase PepB [Photobacterium iliopiscarium]KJG12492.1 aminopeptidase B [Photobacterium iliopiscarium]PST98404.1 aminopeptidase PepB [Photobacterium iliopiscarium]PSV80427.1 aminopeptidase PepB [Photobacterium iliopiscarium]